MRVAWLPGVLQTVICLRHRLQRIDRLARLSDGYDQRLGADDRVPVAELGGVVHLRRQAGDLLDVVLAHHRGVQARAHRDEDHPLDAPQGAGGWHVLQIEAQRLEARPPADRVEDRLRLLHYLLEHEVLVAPLGRGHRVEGDGLRGALLLRPVLRPVGGAVPRHRRHLAVGQVDDPPRVRQKGGQVAGEEHLALAVAHHHAAGVPHPGGEHGVRLRLCDHQQGVGAL
jgi:hypothetical protein